jgi:hypothetical protein
VCPQPNDARGNYLIGHANFAGNAAVRPAFAPLAHKFKTVLCWCRQIEGQDGLVMGYGVCALNNQRGSDDMQPSKFAQSEFSVRTHVGIFAQHL